MGLFDSFYNVPINCPNCGTSMLGEEWQTKDLECIMSTYYWPTYVNNQLNYFHFYSECPKCKKWVEPKVILNNGFTVKVETDDGKVLWELEPIKALVKLSNECEHFRDESKHRKSFATGLAAFIWKNHKDKRDDLFKLLEENLKISRNDFERYSVRSCYNPCGYIAGIIGGPQNYCWVLAGKTEKEALKESSKFNEVLKKLPVGKERSEMVNALVWNLTDGVIEKEKE